MATSQRDNSGKARPVSQETRAEGVGGELSIYKEAGSCWMQGRQGVGFKLEQSEVA